MLSKRFKFLLVGGVVLMVAILVVSVVKITDKVFAAAQSVHSLKVFIQDQEKLESAVNTWFSSASKHIGGCLQFGGL